jgi:hypothetical protein
MAASLAGAWGLEKKKEMRITNPLFGATTNKEMFGDQHIKKHKEEEKHTLAKFRKMKEAQTMILTYADTNVHTKHSKAWDHGEAESIGDAPNPVDSLKLSRTVERVKKLGDAPIAIGRSGARVEVGINASGLLGERLMTSAEPSRNTFVQRSWLPVDDPSLGYKINGVPVAHMPNDVSLDLTSNTVKPGWVHAREAIFTGDALSKVGARRAGVYLDEFRADGSRVRINP